MENNIKNHQVINILKDLTKRPAFKLIIFAGLSLFWVVFMWNFWDKGPYALGINAFVFLSLFIWTFISILREKEHFSKSDWSWIIPLLLIALSFLIYDNPFIKIINILVFPVLFAGFYNYAFLDNKEKRYWNPVFFLRILQRIFSFFSKLLKSLMLYLEMIVPADKGKKGIVSKVIAGVGLFLLIALTVFIPLLSSADPAFADKMGLINAWVKEIFSGPWAYKVIVFIILSVSMLSMSSAWGRKLDYEESGEDKKKIDPIVPGIVLGGILMLYLLFLWVQVSRLWVGSLPFDFKETESLVKSGFWQLLFLSMINIVIYFFTYRKTVPLVQWILMAFTVASLLLLSSAGYRMGLYVVYYGFSYEKFFASYTVIYCLVLFIWLISRLFIKKRSNIVKFLVMLFLWMYSVVTILPIEQFIFRTNIQLSRISQSRIRLSEMRMLSPDVLALAEYYGSLGEPWVAEQKKNLADKKWYELNLMNIFK